MVSGERRHLFDAHRLHVDVEGGDGVGEARDAALVLLEERERPRLAVLDDALDHRALKRLVGLRQLLQIRFRLSKGASSRIRFHP